MNGGDKMVAISPGHKNSLEENLLFEIEANPKQNNLFSAADEPFLNLIESNFDDVDKKSRAPSKRLPPVAANRHSSPLKKIQPFKKSEIHALLPCFYLWNTGLITEISKSVL